MKKIVYFECEICRRRHDTEKEALECENRGVPKPLPHLVGLMFSDNFYGDKMVFAIPPDYGTPEGIERLTDMHFLGDKRWACRDTNAKDSIGESFCGSGGFFTIPKYHPLIQSPALRRMVDFLRSVGITPKIMNEDGSTSPYEDHHGRFHNHRSIFS